MPTFTRTSEMLGTEGANVTYMGLTYYPSQWKLSTTWGLNPLTEYVFTAYSSAEPSSDFTWTWDGSHLGWKMLTDQVDPYTNEPIFNWMRSYQMRLVDGTDNTPFSTTFAVVEKKWEENDTNAVSPVEEETM